jgi:hypothetical protein
MDDYKNFFNILFERSYLNYFIYLCALTGSALLGVTFYTYVHLNKDIDLTMFTVGLFLVSPLLIFIIILLTIRCVTCFQVTILKPLAEFQVINSRV